MHDTSITDLDTGTTTVGAAEIEALAARLRGKVLEPDQAAYDEARSVWNPMIDRKPGLIVRCAGASDVGRLANRSIPDEFRAGRSL